MRGKKYPEFTYRKYSSIHVEAIKVYLNPLIMLKAYSF